MENNNNNNIQENYDEVESEDVSKPRQKEELLQTQLKHLNNIRVKALEKKKQLHYKKCKIWNNRLKNQN